MFCDIVPELAGTVGVVTTTEISQTALTAAAARAAHLIVDDRPYIFTDPLAETLLGERAEELIAYHRLRGEHPVLAGARAQVTCRARLAEDRATNSGVDQYVILGAGLDSFAYRRGDLLERMRVFEVDHPASQQWKRRRLTELRIDSPPSLVYVPLDFEQQALGDGLTAAGFDFTARAVWSWLGVTMYLTTDAIRATLATIAQCPPGARVVLTYNLPRSELTGLSLTIETTMRAIVSELGEPMISLFTPVEIQHLVQALGYGDITHFGPDEARNTYFADRDDGHFGGPQRILTAVVGDRPR